MLAKEGARISSPVVQETGQYNLLQILGIWALVSLPMALLAWVVAPVVIPFSPFHPGITYWLLIIAGMIWQFVVSLIILYRELGTLRWEVVRKRVWLNPPLDPITHQPNRKLYLWLAPCLLFSGLFSLGWSSYLDAPFSRLFPMPFFADITLLGSPEFRGQWWILGITLLSALLNYFLGEELLFRGVLLPKMRGAFGRWDWLANGILFGLYHLHKPWMLPSIILSSLAITWPANRFQSNWMAVIVHGVEGIILIVIIVVVLAGLV